MKKIKLLLLVAASVLFASCATNGLVGPGSRNAPPKSTVQKVNSVGLHNYPN